MPINPLVAVLLGWLVLEEKISLPLVISMGAVLFGVYLVNTSKS